MSDFRLGLFTGFVVGWNVALFIAACVVFR